MINNSLISVIVPVFNREKYIQKCINSIQNQTYKKLQIIIVDDHSNDNSVRICEELSKKDSRISIIHNNNKGVSSARNAGLDIADGEWITFVDSDDTIDLENYEKALKENEKYNADIVCWGMKYIKNESIVSYDNSKKTIHFSSNINYITKIPNYRSICNKLIRKEIAKSIYFDSNIAYGEDLLFFLDCFFNSKQLLIIGNFNPYNYYQHNENSTNKIDENYKNNIIQSNNLIIKRLESQKSYKSKRLINSIKYQTRQFLLFHFEDYHLCQTLNNEIKWKFIFFTKPKYWLFFLCLNFNMEKTFYSLLRLRKRILFYIKG